MLGAPKLTLHDQLFHIINLNKNFPISHLARVKMVVVLHAGSTDVGFIPECEMAFVGTHDEMNSKLFIEWFDRLLWKLDYPILIVL